MVDIDEVSLLVDETVVEALLADNLKLDDDKLSILFTEDVAAQPFEI